MEHHEINAVAILIVALFSGLLIALVFNRLGQLRGGFQELDEAKGLLSSRISNLDMLAVERERSTFTTVELARKRIEELERRLDVAEKASGGYWQTKDGRALPIRDMTSAHISNCLRGGFCNERQAGLMLAEIKRRESEASKSLTQEEHLKLAKFCAPASQAVHDALCTRPAPGEVCDRVAEPRKGKPCRFPFPYGPCGTLGSDGEW